jgi:hypothetical protein
MLPVIAIRGLTSFHAKHRSRSHDAVIRVYDDAGDLIETHEHTGLCFCTFAF